MDKSIIEKTFNHIIESKCGRTYLTKADKQFIEDFKKDWDKFPTHLDELKELWEKHQTVQEKHNYPLEQKKAVQIWGGGGFMNINGKIYNTKHWQHTMEEEDAKETNRETIEETKNLQDAIDESPRVPNDTSTIREGHWEKGHKPGDVIVQKGFASTSYIESIGVSNTKEENNYKMTYYIRSGAKGIILNQNQFQNLPEFELLLGKNTRQYVLEQNDDNRTVSILVLPDR